MRKIIFSVMTIGIVAMMAGAGALAIFSDTEASRGNTLTAGTLDLQIGVDESSASYTDDVISWAPKDLGEGDLIFNWNDVKPGDEGEATIVVYVDNNDAWLVMKVGNLFNEEMGMTEPEMEVDDTPDRGELADHLYLKIWEDDGNNILDKGEDVWWEGFAIDLPEVFEFDVPGGENYYIGFSWSVDLSVGNIIQGDQVQFDVEFLAEQKRNNNNEGNVFSVNEKIYLNNDRSMNGTMLYEVVIDDENERANMYELYHIDDENFDDVKAIAVTPMGENLYVYDHTTGHLGVYEIATDTFTNLGEVSGLNPSDTVLAAFTPDGALYVMSGKTDELYEIDIETVTATSHGTITREDDGQPLNIYGADIAFTPLGRLSIWVNSDSADTSGAWFVVTDLENPVARFLGNPEPITDFSGTAFRHAGTGNLLGSNRDSDIIWSVHPWDATVATAFQAYVEDTDEEFDIETGDMAGTLYDP